MHVNETTTAITGTRMGLGGNGGGGHARNQRWMTYPQEPLEVDAAGVEGPMQMVDGVLDRVVLGHQIYESAVQHARTET